MSVEMEIVEDNTELIRSAKDRAVLAALEAVGLQAERNAKKLCPVDTGNLRNSIDHAVDSSEPCAVIGTNVEYAVYVEFGTTRMKKQPFIRPAVHDHSDQYRRIFQHYLENA